jgi:integrase
MSDRPRSQPKYRKHKQSGQAIVTLTDGLGVRRDFLLGEYGSAASKQKYDRLVGEWQAAGRRLTPPENGSGITINELVHRFRDHARRYYRRPDGTPTNEVTEYRYACRPLRELYGLTPAKDFGPLALKTVRERYIAAGWCRGLVNRRIGRVRHVFKWATSEQLVPPSVYAALRTVAGLAFGRTKAREAEPVEPVSDAAVDAVRPFLSRHVWGLVEFQRYTGCRPGEACIVRACDLDMTGEVWVYRPETHKSAWRNKPRLIAIGPRAQDVVRAFLTTRTEDYLFSPRRAREERYAAKREARKTPVQPSQVVRAKARARRQPQKLPGDKYRTSSYQHAITAACERAGIEAWSPNQLRHSHATMIRRQYGLEAAQVALGHSRADVTQVYAERDQALALKIAAEVG